MFIDVNTTMLLVVSIVGAVLFITTILLEIYRVFFLKKDRMFWRGTLVLANIFFGGAFPTKVLTNTP